MPGARPAASGRSAPMSASPSAWRAAHCCSSPGSASRGSACRIRRPSSSMYCRGSCGAWDLVRANVADIRAGRWRADIDLLMLLAAVGAAALGEWVEGTFLLFLFSLANAAEHYAMGRATGAIRALGDLTPPTARLRVSGRPGRGRADGAGHARRARARAPGRAHPRRWCRAQRPIGGRPGAHHRRVGAGGQGAWRPGVRRHGQRRRRPAGGDDRRCRRANARSHHPAGGRRAGEQGPHRAAHGDVRADLRARWCWWRRAC